MVGKVVHNDYLDRDQNVRNMVLAKSEFKTNLKERKCP